MAIGVVAGTTRSPRTDKFWTTSALIAYAILWLASDEASFVNGQDISTDGGAPGGARRPPRSA